MHSPDRYAFSALKSVRTILSQNAFDEEEKYDGIMESTYGISAFPHMYRFFVYDSGSFTVLSIALLIP